MSLEKSFLKRHKIDQAGVVSFITVSLLAIVLTLITTAFVKSMISNQRQVLDNQLSTQAFYAAETGINDAITLLNQATTNDTLDDLADSIINNPNEPAPKCGDFINEIETNVGINDYAELDSSSDIKYTCVLVSSIVPNVLLTSPAVNNGTFFPVQAWDSDLSIDKVNISWGNSGQSIPDGSATELLPNTETGWGTNSVALMRITFYYPNDVYTRDSLLGNQKTFFLRPIEESEEGYSQISFADLDSDYQQQPVGVHCNASNSPICSLDVTGVSGLTDTQGKFYIKITPIYNSSDITFSAYSSTETLIHLLGAQYSIDVTGRANDVYRRIEVRRSVLPNYDFPDSVVASGNSSGSEDNGNLCKQFLVWPGGLQDPSECSFTAAPESEPEAE